MFVFFTGLARLGPSTLVRHGAAPAHAALGRRSPVHLYVQRQSGFRWSENPQLVHLPPPLSGKPLARPRDNRLTSVLIGGQTVSFAYAGNDPVNKSDPNGHFVDAMGGWYPGTGDDPGYSYNPLANPGMTAAMMAGPIVAAVMGSPAGVAGLAMLELGTIGSNDVPSLGGLGAGRSVSRAVNQATDSSWVGKIQGTAQKTGKDAWHADASYQKAVEYAKDPTVASVHLNQTIDTALGTRGVSRQQPDITVVYKDGTSVRICECVSASQTVSSQQKKLDGMATKINDTGKKTVTEVTERGGPNDPTGGGRAVDSLSPRASSAIENGEAGLF
jgi:hypothetical protein